MVYPPLTHMPCCLQVSEVLYVVPREVPQIPQQERLHPGENRYSAHHTVGVTPLRQFL